MVKSETHMLGISRHRWNNPLMTAYIFFSIESCIEAFLI